MKMNYNAEIEKIIPEEERAVTETNDLPTAGTQSSSTAPIAVIVNNNVEELLPEEERAENVKLEEEIDDFKEAEQQGYFSIINGMARIENVLDDKIYAAVKVDKNGGRTILFSQQYENGEFSAKMCISQSDLLLAASCDFLQEKVNTPTLKSAINRFILNIYKEYFSKFAGETALDVLDILRVLVAVRNQLPTYYDGQDIFNSPKALYQEVISIIQGKGQYYRMEYVEDKKAYYGVRAVDFEKIAEELKVTSLELAKKLKEYGFLYLTASSQGYQTKVRITPKKNYVPDFPLPEIESLYCILKLDYISKQRQLRSEKNS